MDTSPSYRVGTVNAARHSRSRLAATAALVVVISLLAIANPARAELRTETEITYVADVKQGNLTVESRMVLTNLTPDVREGNQITRFFFDEISITVPETVEGLRATSGGEALSHTIRQRQEDKGRGVVVAAIDLGRPLGFQDTMEIELMYEIPGDPPRSETTFRINPAYINFAVGGWGDPGLVTLNVVTPTSFDVEITPSEWDETETVGDMTIHTTSGIENPNEFFIRVKGYNDDALVTETLAVGQAEIVTGAWPGDTEWTDQVKRSVVDGLPVLTGLVGLPWGLDDPLPVNESAEVFLAGYGGWYQRDRNLVEVSEWADPHLVLHELSHVWFNQELFTGRWINEGLAEVFSGRAVVLAGLGESEELRLDGPLADDPGVGPLNSWVVPDREQLDADQIRAYEEYGYTASQWVIQEVADDIGFDSLAAVLVAADEDLIAYRGAPEAERVDARDDWRRLLDLLEELGGSAVAGELFESFVTDEDLTVRRQARDEYHDLVEMGQGWHPPLYVRAPMSAWEFDEASSRITEAREVLENRFAAESNLAVLGITPAGTLEDVYESATETLEDADLLAGELVQASEAVIEARNALDVERSLIVEIGLLGNNPEAEYREALEKLEAEDLDQAMVEADEVTMMLAGAEDAGQLRLGVAAGGLVLVVGGTVLVVVRRRPGRAG